MLIHSGGRNDKNGKWELSFIYTSIIKTNTYVLALIAAPAVAAGASFGEHSAHLAVLIRLAGIRRTLPSLLSAGNGGHFDRLWWLMGLPTQNAGDKRQKPRKTQCLYRIQCKIYNTQAIVRDPQISARSFHSQHAPDDSIHFCVC